MKLASSISRPAWVLLTLSVLLAAAGWITPHVRPVPSAPDPELAGLRAEQTQVRELGDAALHALRQRVAAHPQPAWTTAQLDALVSALAGDWRSEWQTGSAGTRRLTISRRIPRLTDWPSYLEALRSWTLRPGVVVDSFEIVASGFAAARRFQRVALTLRFAVTGATTGNAEWAPGGPLPVAAAVGAATARNVGPVQSGLRPPPFRPDLPGVPGRDESPGTRNPNQETP